MFGVDLPSYHGPLDLLFYLIRREELSIEEIALSRITSQYLEYVSYLQELDLDEVGEFIDITSQLIELKSRSVLPSEEPSQDDSVSESIEPDSMSHLIERLIQYKRFRDAASVLDEQSRQWQLRFPRTMRDLPPRRYDESTAPIAKIEVWDLVSAFGRILKASQKPVEHKLLFDNTPIHVHMMRLHSLIKEQGELELQNLFECGMHKSTVISLFIATLELTRHHGLMAKQSGPQQPLILVPGPEFPEELSVLAIDNANTDQFKSANMLISGR